MKSLDIGLYLVAGVAAIASPSCGRFGLDEPVDGENASTVDSGAAVDTSSGDVVGEAGRDIKPDLDGRSEVGDLDAAVDSSNDDRPRAMDADSYSDSAQEDGGDALICRCPSNGGVVRVPAAISETVASVSGDTCSVSYQQGFIFAMSDSATVCSVEIVLDDGLTVMGLLTFAADGVICCANTYGVVNATFALPDAGVAD